MSESKFGSMDARVPTTPSTQHKALIQEIERILGFRNELLNTFSGSLDVIENGYRLMKEQMENIVNDRPVSVKQHEAQSIGRVFDILVEFVLYRELTPIFRDLVYALCILGRNWNDNTINDKNLSTNITIVAKLVRDIKTIDETMDLLKKLIEKGREIYGYEPPAFALSEHYFKTIQEQNIKEETEEKQSETIEEVTQEDE